MLCCVMGALQAKAIMMVASQVSGTGTPSSSASTPSTPSILFSSPGAIVSASEAAQRIKSCKRTCN